MTYAMRYIRSFVMVALCMNSVFVVASERSFPVPKLNQSFGKDGAKSFAAGGLFLASFFHKIGNNIDLSGAMSNIDLSNLKTVLDENKVMLSTLVTATTLLLLTKYLKNSEKFGPWCQKKYDTISQSAGDTKKNMVEKLPDDVQTLIWVCEKPFQMLFALLKKYIGMSQTTIISSLSSPVVGKLIDCAFVCPIPFCSFTGLGWASSGIILTKGYYDQRFDKIETQLNQLATDNKTMHQKTNQQMTDGFNNIDTQFSQTNDRISNNTDELKKEIQKKAEKISGQIEGIHNQIQQVDSNNKEALEKLSKELTQATTQMIQLHEEMNQKQLKRDQKTEDLFKKLDEASQQLANAKKDLISLVTNLIEKSSEETKKGFEVINETLSKMAVEQSDQGGTLQKMQQSISVLLDNKEIADTKFTELLDFIQTSSRTLKEVNEKVSSQDDILQSIQAVFEQMKKDREELSGIISSSISQSSDISSRLSKLELQVDQNQKHVEHKFDQVESKVDTHHAELIQLLKKNEEKFELFKQESIERESVFLARLNQMEEERKKAEKENSEKLDTLVNFTNQCKNQQLITHEKSTKRRSNLGNSDFTNYQNNTNYNALMQVKQTDLQKFVQGKGERLQQTNNF